MDIVVLIIYLVVICITTYVNFRLNKANRAIYTLIKMQDSLIKDLVKKLSFEQAVDTLKEINKKG